jgi:hypothetical protein
VIALVAISIYFFLEAWLEIPVIALKDGGHPNYAVLNRREHFRSAVLAGFVIGIAVVYAGAHHQWIYFPAIILSRRVFFDWYQAKWRMRPMSLYEGDDWWVRVFRKIFGAKGRKVEHYIEVVIILSTVTVGIIDCL